MRHLIAFTAPICLFLTASSSYASEPPMVEGLPANPVEVLLLPALEQPTSPQFSAPQKDAPALDAFSHIAAPTEIGPGEFDCQTPAVTGRCSPTVVAVFSGPAQIDRPTDWDDPSPLGAVVIFEGMRVELYPNGRYHVTFVTEIPRTTIRLRMQLQLVDIVDGVPHPMGTITLPLILFNPDPNHVDTSPRAYYRVSRSGYSHMLNGLTVDDLTTLQVQRTGFAEFGTVPTR
ncbi:MAG: hypothetical protein R3C01_12790 [Planctomycetaceae bacterium]